MHRNEVHKTIKTALHRGLNEYTSDTLAADVNDRLGTNALDAETAATLMATIEQHDEALATAITDDILPQLDIPPAHAGDTQQRVAADGDSILSNNSNNIVYLSSIALNGVLYGRAILDNDIIAAAVATAGICAILTVWLNRQHDMHIKSKD